MAEWWENEVEISAAKKTDLWWTLSECVFVGAGAGMRVDMGYGCGIMYGG